MMDEAEKLGFRLLGLRPLPLNASVSYCALTKNYRFHRENLYKLEPLIARSSFSFGSNYFFSCMRQ